MLIISFQTLAELELWALAAGWGEGRKQQPDQCLRRYIVEDSRQGCAVGERMCSTSLTGVGDR
jgi:hypothetical protein